MYSQWRQNDSSMNIDKKTHTELRCRNYFNRHEQAKLIVSVSKLNNANIIGKLHIISWKKILSIGYCFFTFPSILHWARCQTAEISTRTKQHSTTKTPPTRLRWCCKYTYVLISTFLMVRRKFRKHALVRVHQWKKNKLITFPRFRFAVFQHLCLPKRTVLSLHRI